MKARIIQDKSYTEERPLFNENGLLIRNVTFDVGESPLKEASFIEAQSCEFIGRYPFWYAKDLKISETHFDTKSRAGLWYSENVELKDCVIDAPKTLRRCRKIMLKNVSFSDAVETLWDNDDVYLENVDARGAHFCMGTKNLTIKDCNVTGDYICMNASDVKVENLRYKGKYSFDGVKNLEIRNSSFDTKDCLWNCENVTVYDSYIKGEYIGWNSKNVTLVNCTVESLQGFCYMENLKVVNCRLAGTSLAFEYTTGEIEATDSIDSVFNPSGCSIKASRIDKLILDETKIDIDRSTFDAEIGERLNEFDGIIPGIPTAAME